MIIVSANNYVQVQYSGLHIVYRYCKWFLVDNATGEVLNEYSSDLPAIKDMKKILEKYLSGVKVVYL